jgi:RNA polymerase sigma-70 factor (ECF subfamily)
MIDRQQEFREAFEKHSDELFRHASLRLSNRERALEITQETFLKAWEFLQKGEVIREYRPFLFRTLNNQIIDEYRRKKSTSLDAMMEGTETSAIVEGHLLRDETDIFEETATQYDAKRVLKHVQHLPENYRTVIVMRYVDGFSPSEIADQIGESENAVSVRLHRGMRKLKDLLASSTNELL